METRTNDSASLCYPCQLDQHFVPPRLHVWPSEQEIAHFQEADPAMAREICACPCANPCRAVTSEEAFGR